MCRTDDTHIVVQATKKNRDFASSAFKPANRLVGALMADA